MNRQTLLVALLGFVVCTTAAAQQPPPVRLSRAEVMKQKLDASQKLLSALALENYDAIAASSQRLSLLTLESSWNVLQTPEYRQESEEFRRAADTITNAARERNIDGATLAYVHATMKCVHCHKYLRAAGK